MNQLSELVKIERKAKGDYAEYKRRYRIDERRIGRYEGQIDKITEDIARHPSAYNVHRLGEAAVSLVEAQAHITSEEVVPVAAANYHENRDAYWELALIDAHKAEVLIDVTQPLIIGRQVKAGGA